MIFCFSGTGNSLWVAQNIAEQLREKVVMIGDALRAGECNYTLKEGERIGFVFPVLRIIALILAFTSKMLKGLVM